MIGLILIGVGLACEAIGFGVSSWMSWSTIVGEILTIGAIGVYVWAVLKFNDFVEEQTVRTAFRAWQIAYISFWVSLGVTVINIILSFVARYAFTSVFSSAILGVLYQWGSIIGDFIGLALIAVGVYFGWSLKSLWWNFDPAGALANEKFDYLKWTDRSNPDSILVEKLTTEYSVAF